MSVWGNPDWEIKTVPVYGMQVNYLYHPIKEVALISLDSGNCETRLESGSVVNLPGNPDFEIQTLLIC